MSNDTGTQTSELTYESIVEYILTILRRAGALPPDPVPTPWDAFLRLSDLIHETYEIPSTTFTPIMRRLLFALGFAARPSNIVGVGTYVGYTFSWLLRCRSDPEAAPFFETAMGIDVDAQANALARRNCAILGHGERLTMVDADGVVAVTGSRQPIDLLYLDIDDPLTGKSAYWRVLDAALPHLPWGALVLAHDPCVPNFAQDFAIYHRYIQESGLFFGPWVFPVDACGLSIAVVRKA